jgi:hypothetical protein
MPAGSMAGVRLHEARWKAPVLRLPQYFGELRRRDGHLRTALISDSRTASAPGWSTCTGQARASVSALVVCSHWKGCRSMLFPRLRILSHLQPHPRSASGLVHLLCGLISALKSSSGPGSSSSTSGSLHCRLLRLNFQCCAGFAVWFSVRLATSSACSAARSTRT